MLNYFVALIVTLWFFFSLFLVCGSILASSFETEWISSSFALMQLNVKFNLVKAETSLIAFVIKGLFLKKNVLISVLLKASFNSL